MGRRMNREKDPDWGQQHADNVRAWNDAIVATIEAAWTGKSIGQLADRMRYARSTLSTLMNQDSNELRRMWTLDNLVALSMALGWSLSSFMQEAELRMKNEGAFIVSGLYQTQPRSKERLQCLIHSAAEFDPVEDERKYDGLLGLEYQVSRFEFSNPEFCREYYDGLLTDDDALSILKKAVDLEVPLGEEAPPMWAKLMQVYKK